MVSERAESEAGTSARWSADTVVAHASAKTVAIIIVVDVFA